MKIRVISDLHLDVNKKYPFSFKKNDKDVFTLIAGDTSGLPSHAIDWIKKNVKRGMFVSGNHIVYNNTEKTIQTLKEEYAAAFPLESDVTYLDVNTGVFSKQIPGTNILVVGTTLYTDYKLVTESSKYEIKYYNENNKIDSDDPRPFNKWMSKNRMNDFAWGYISREPCTRKILMPDDYEKIFEESFSKIKQVVEENKDKEIIVMTHHCPSKKCISDYYVDSNMNASYCSDLDEFILANTNIKAWVCGHVHHQDSFNVGQCLVVMNPRGYEFHLESSNWNPNTFIDTDTWTLVKEKFEFSKKLLAKREDDEKKLKLYSAFFI